MIITLITGFLFSIAFCSLLLCSMLLAEVVAASFPYTPVVVPDCLSGRLAVLIPAYNEAATIQKTLATLMQQIDEADQVIVIADNCTDGTENIARAEGATVLERHDLDHIGKGYALDFGLKSLTDCPPDVIVVLDADSIILPDTLNLLKYQVLTFGYPSQAVYLMEQPIQPNLKDQISVFAFKIKNWVRPLGLSRLGIPCPLTGTGMAFPWKAISAVDVANSELAEDMKIGLDLTMAGYPPHLCPAAKVLGQLPSKPTAINSQRTRWEHGHLQVLLRYVPQMCVTALRQQRWTLFFTALDLAIPPLSLLVILYVVIAIAITLFYCVYSIWQPFVFIALSGLLLLGAILTAWIGFGRQELPIQRLLLAPIYLIWKIPIYINFFVQPQKEWVRTERDRL